jgi:triacylglycerol lipase
MGGLDARYALSKLGLAPNVASLTTLGTPHRGTPIADLVDRAALGGVGEGMHDLTTSRAAAFNDAIPDVGSVLYTSIVGATSTVSPLLEPAYEYLLHTAGENDGLVPASSQPWGSYVTRVKADHLAQIGWARRFDLRKLYAPLVTHLASFGF